MIGWMKYDIQEINWYLSTFPAYLFTCDFHRDVLRVSSVYKLCELKRGSKVDFKNIK